MVLPQKIKQWLTDQDGLDKLRLEETNCSIPGEDEVLVEIHSVSLNYRDTEVCMGLYNHHNSVEQLPAVVPCSDMCGIVVAVGPVSKNSSDPYKNPAFGLQIGDRVMSTFAQTHLTGQIEAKDLGSGLGGPAPGVLTQYRVFPTYGLVKVPEYMSDDEAACLSIAAMTAWMSLNCMRSNGEIIGKGETVVCQGTGGVSISAAQIASAAGAHTIVTSSSDEKLQRAAQLGAKDVINYRTNPNWDAIVLEKTSTRGADIVIEVGGATTLRKSFECVRFGGLIACIGYLSGKQDEEGDRTNTNLLCLKRNVTLKGILNGPRDELERMLRFYEQKQIRPVVDRTFTFDEANEALHYLFSGGHFGKVVIKVKA
ncbi:NAD(P)-binding protein [Dothidotthia symphoricarpi CBS 119687]|uniref:NAD(P)-binding protein n=1 Tax=Dothidotthia symphoricarpi CBS 119687 TaxID=1392245 RepID=A0A6A6AH24_9PLEO|nr:NAD(P)-binding protein [Dothidotthia symphoricarpi CBS 119687]KAF2130543.1 NAD(P)-binding protein [Dothidotthia symphoricarpi CBS 119687]